MTAPWLTHLGFARTFVLSFVYFGMKNMGGSKTCANGVRFRLEEEQIEKEADIRLHHEDAILFSKSCGKSWRSIWEELLARKWTKLQK